MVLLTDWFVHHPTDKRDSVCGCLEYRQYVRVEAESSWTGACRYLEGRRFRSIFSFGRRLEVEREQEGCCCQLLVSAERLNKLLESRVEPELAGGRGERLRVGKIHYASIRYNNKADYRIRRVRYLAPHTAIVISIRPDPI